MLRVDSRAPARSPRPPGSLARIRSPARTSPTCGVEVPVEVSVDREPHLGRPLSPTNRPLASTVTKGSTVGAYLTAWQETVEVAPALTQTIEPAGATPP